MDADQLIYVGDNRKKKQKPEQLGGLANCGSVLKLEIEPIMASGAEITQKKYEKRTIVRYNRDQRKNITIHQNSDHSVSVVVANTLPRF